MRQSSRSKKGQEKGQEIKIHPITHSGLPYNTKLKAICRRQGADSKCPQSEVPVSIVVCYVRMISW